MTFKVFLTGAVTTVLISGSIAFADIKDRALPAALNEQTSNATPSYGSSHGKSYWRQQQ